MASATFDTASARTQVPMVATSCAHCGIVFCVPEHFDKTKREDGSDFHCPNGHSLIYGKGEVDRLKRELAEAQRQRQSALDDAAFAKREAERVQRELIAQKGQATKLRKRAAAGVCPCCNRRVRQLTYHMKAKHPDYAEAAT